jgi:PAS domain S-box-containing protein
MPINPSAQSPAEKRVLLLPPTRRDAEALYKVLSGVAIECTICPDIDALCAEIEVGAGVVLISEEALASDAAPLIACVREQPVWSDLPVVVLSHARAETPKLSPLLVSLGNVSVLERPIRITTLLSIIRSSLRARERQYQVRRHLVEQKQAAHELREREERLRLAVQTGKLGVWELDLKTDEMSCSPVCKGMFGRGAADAFSYDDLWAATHPEDAQRVRQTIGDALRDGSEYDVEYRNVWPDGSVHWVLARGHAEYTPDGTPLRLIAITLDITDRKLAEEQRSAMLAAERAARTEAERAGQMKDEFLATLGHELRTPLNAIVGWAQILRHNPSNAEEVVEGIEVIERNARAQTQIIEDLLDMSRIISGKVRLDVRNVDLPSVIGSAVATVRHAADARGVHLQMTLDPTGAVVHGDASRLQQIFWNLISNAVKFSPRGARVQIVLERVATHIEVRVVDTGEGIAPEFLPHVFERFRQADSSTTRRHGGLGLGLAIVKQLVELHGGSVSARSGGLGEGATFTVTLPVSAVNVEPGPKEPALEPPRRPHAAEMDENRANPLVTLGGLKVLVVDDEPDARAVVRRLLEDCEAVVVTAGSAAEAYETFRQERPQVLVSDIGMPGEDGYELVSRIRKLDAAEGGRVPAIALTAYARSQDRAQALSAGFQSHISKPVDPSELIATVAGLAGAGAGGDGSPTPQATF